MGRGVRLDRAAILDMLPPIEPDPAEDDPIDRPSLRHTLLTLAKVDQETEFALCEQVARHLLADPPTGATHGG
jgi:hypothetical protein